MKHYKLIIPNTDGGHSYQARPAENSGILEVGACAKAILVGEHSVVYGTQSVAMPLTHMRIEFAGRFTDPASSTQIIINGQDVTSDAVELIAQAFYLLNLPQRPMLIHGTSNVLIGAGLGSSATLCVGIIRIIQGLTGHKSSTGEIASLANRLEERFHGNPSGLDSAVVASEKVIKFRRGETPKAFDISPVSLAHGANDRWRFAIIDSGERASTKSMVEKASSSFQGSGSEAILADFESVSLQTITGLKTGNIDFVADAMNECAKLLTRINVMTDRLTSMITEAEKIGCLAAKSTGAGGGGCVLALLAPGLWEEQLIRLKAIYSAEHVFEAIL